MAAGAPVDESRWTGEWPLVGRGEELGLLREARLGPLRAVVLGGHQGVGKSRLAEEALAQARADRWAVDRVDGATATAAVPLGAVAHLAPPEAARAGDPLALLVAITDRLRERTARRPLMILVDDAAALDEASLALVRRATTIPQLFMLLTTRSDEAVPTPILQLWKDGLADRVELVALSRDETYRLVAEALGGEVDARSLSWLWNSSLGNPLFLRELVLVDGGSGWVRGPDGAWRYRFQDRPGGRRLVELIRSRVGRLGPGHRRVLELLTVAGPMRVDQMAAVASPDEVAAVADRGLVTIRSDRAKLGSVGGGAPSDAVVSLAHPLYGIVLTDGASLVRARGLRRQVLEVLRTSGRPSPSDAARIAALELDLGRPLDSHQLVLAANLVLMAYPLSLIHI